MKKIYERMAGKLQRENSMESRAQPVLWGQAGNWGAKPQGWEDEGGQCFSGHRKDRLTKKKRLGLQKRGMLA